MSSTARNILALALLQACLCGCFCCDEVEVVEYHLDYCSLGITNLDNSGQHPWVSVDNRVPRRALGLNLVFGVADGVCASGTGNPFMAAAYATACDDYQLADVISLDTLTAISIATRFDLDADTGAGDDVSDRFRVITADGEIFPIADYLATEIFEVGFERVYPDVDDNSVEVKLLLTTPPVGTDSAQFDVRVQLASGAELAAESPLARLL